MAEDLTFMTRGSALDEDAEFAGMSVSRHQQKWALTVVHMLLLGIQIDEAEDLTKAIEFR